MELQQTLKKACAGEALKPSERGADREVSFSMKVNQPVSLSGGYLQVHGCAFIRRNIRPARHHEDRFMDYACTIVQYGRSGEAAEPARQTRRRISPAYRRRYQHTSRQFARARDTPITVVGTSERRVGAHPDQASVRHQLALFFNDIFAKCLKSTSGCC